MHESLDRISNIGHLFWNKLYIDIKTSIFAGKMVQLIANFGLDGCKRMRHKCVPLCIEVQRTCIVLDVKKYFFKAPNFRNEQQFLYE